MFNFNNIDFSALPIKIVDIKRPLIAPQRISSSSIEGKAEEVFHRKTSQSYNIDVEFYFFSDTGLTLRSDIRDLAGMLDTSAPAKLIFKDEPDKFIYAIVEETDIERKGRYAICNVSFKCLDPHWYALIDDVFTYTTGGAKSFTRKGNAESYPIIEIEGTSGAYTVSANGSSMKYSGSLSAGEKLVVDSALLTAYILQTNGEKRSVLTMLDKLDFPVLNKGKNDFTITASGGATLSKCKLSCNSRWK